jgi:hypothetical protein
MLMFVRCVKKQVCKKESMKERKKGIKRDGDNTKNNDPRVNLRRANRNARMMKW